MLRSKKKLLFIIGPFLVFYSVLAHSYDEPKVKKAFEFYFCNEDKIKKEDANCIARYKDYKNSSEPFLKNCTINQETCGIAIQMVKEIFNKNYPSSNSSCLLPPPHKPCKE